MNAREVMTKIRKAGFKMNVYAHSYFNAFPNAELEYGEDGVRTQILYFFSNAKAMNAEQKAVKEELMKYAQKR